MKYVTIPVTPFQQNCSLIWCEATKEAAVIDPGGNVERIIERIEKEQLTLTMILLTHGHIDHVGGAKALADLTGVDIIGPHKDDEFWLENLPKQSQNFGFAATEAFVPHRYLEQDDLLHVGHQQLKVLHCPGHTPGHVVFHHQASQLAWVGDVIFRGSIGRTDFPGSSHADLIASITQRLWPLGNDVTFVPGHGPISTVGEERKHNPFVADQLLD
ncbi:MBL fold metallo-hydrolase [Shewanella sp. NIFS-20-20]|uniref:MBL fold metallo-hydrolase n=1 Tax=Shewanella sp. NIFS-20-20 TaxID=2853806 RepID=UPI001C456DA2|nr:MBL fold metallo-hydrolase [Shewanella sp. NIFS-20-20]MBV7315032.1 MBL fold metallo-hydrolase [Shewanella sp. NIFS-20-20]